MKTEQKSEHFPRWLWTIRNWSPSSIELLWECPKKFEYEVVQELTSSQENAAFAFGSFIHGHLARFFQIRHTTKGTRVGFGDRLAYVNQGAALWKAVIEGRCGPRGFGTPPIKIRWLYPAHHDSLWERLFVILNSFWNFNYSYIAAYRRYLETGEEGEKKIFPLVEKKLDATLPSFRFNNHHVIGTLDRIQRVAGGYEIWDYKTSQHQDAVEYLRQHPAMAFYEELYRQNFGHYPLAIKLYYVQLGIKHGLIEVPLNQSEKARRDRLTQLVVWLDNATSAVLRVMDPKALVLEEADTPILLLDPENPGRFIKQPGSQKCFLCDFNEICVKDQFHGSVAEQIAMIEEAEKKVTAAGEQMMFSIDMPQVPSPVPVWKRKLTLQVKKQRAQQSSSSPAES